MAARDEQHLRLYELDRHGLEALMRDLGEPAYRGRQIQTWLYHHLVDSFEAMTDLPAGLRQRLAEVARLHTLSKAATTDSEDGLATKTLFRLEDGELIETVLMHYLDPADQDERADLEVRTARSGRHTVCISTQAGCAMGCVFCATGQMGLVRDLRLGEVVEQVVEAARRLHAAGQRLTNVVFMGMGEPLANWPATWGAIERLTDPAAFGLGARRITVSTVGLVPGILRLAGASIPVRLAVSLHAPDDDLRSQLVPIDTTYGLDDILSACRDYQARTGRRITFEYVLLDGVNDQLDQAIGLARRLRGLVAHVNLIPVNPTAGSPHRPTPYRVAARFQAEIERRGIPTTLRMRRGIDIQAGCGQLRSRAAEGRLGRALKPAEVPAGAD